MPWWLCDSRRSNCHIDDTNVADYEKSSLAHRPTDYKQWYRTQQDMYRVEYDYMYEPYLLIHRNLPVRYDERFVGYGNDKTSYTFELVRSVCVCVHVETIT
jgi:hypothetical protein